MKVIIINEEKANAVLNELTELELKVWNSVYKDKKTYLEVGLDLGCSEKTVYRIIRKVFERMDNALR